MIRIEADQLGDAVEETMEAEQGTAADDTMEPVDDEPSRSKHEHLRPSRFQDYVTSQVQQFEEQIQDDTSIIIIIIVCFFIYYYYYYYYYYNYYYYKNL